MAEKKEAAEANTEFDYSGKDLEITICRGSGCKSLKSMELIEALRSEVKNAGLSNVTVKQTGCHGFCEAGPIVVINPFDLLYVHVKSEDAKEIISSIKSNELVDRLLFIEEGKKILRKDDLIFYKHQQKYVMRRAGEIDPFDIDEYISHAGYDGLKKALSIKPEEVIETITTSGLRGRGGGGFTTGLKWSFIAKEQSEDKFIVANADEGDPGSFMDRTLLEGDPFAVIEGMTIAAYATGANHGVIYARAEYPQAVEILKNAIEKAREKKYLGDNIMGHEGFNFDIKMSLGAGAFVCGEETALMSSVEGNRGNPRVRPPFPAKSGLWQKPTNINNVKTYAYASHILREGPESFNKYGTEKSPGTAVLCLTGKINYTGVVEVPMGMPLKKVVYEVGGGVRNGSELKAVMTGGPSGGVIPKDMMDKGVDYESLTSIGSIMGSGGVLVLDETDSMVEIAKFFLGFTQAESCGKCTPCREGTYRMHKILDKFISSKAKEEDIDFLISLGEYVKGTSLCGLGQTAPNPILTTIKYYRNEYEALLTPKDVKSYFISAKCVGCTACAKVCPVKCISGEPGKRHTIDQSKCIECGACYKACKFDAIVNKKKSKK